MADIIGGVRERWLSRRALTLHLVALLFVPGCFLAAWWQITRATGGNGLSYLYAVEWPIFAILGVYFWWMLIHTDYESVGLKGMRNRAAVDAPSPSTRAGDVGVAEGAGVAVTAGAAPGQLAPGHALTAHQIPDALPVDFDQEIDPDLAAYNARLATLSAEGAKTWKRPERIVVRRERS